MNDITYAGKHSLIHAVARHTHDHWEYVYCTYGSGIFSFDGLSLPYKKGDVVVIPPRMPHTNASEKGFRNIHIRMASPTLNLKEPAVIADDGNHFLLDAFTAAFYHFYS
ncbi:MAG: AraC family ligand binding domain-containing protein, partial [Clostridia bacterium]|nr:AraC family ligand binding domain-containing protein [Clostridia bacterium]